MRIVMPSSRHKLHVPLLALALCLPTVSAHADPLTDFYSTKTIDFVIGYTPGGTYDLYARLVSRHLGQFIKGMPKILPRNMPGGGSRIAVNYVYAVGPQDGTVLGTADQSLPIEQALGDTDLKVDVSKINWIGNPIISNNTTVTWAGSGIKTINDAKLKESTLGATGASTSSQYPKAMNALLGTKFKIIMGYPGTSDINLAMEKGEVDGKGSDSWAAWKATHPDWISNHKINVLTQIGVEREKDLPDVPLMYELAQTSADAEVLKLLSKPVVIGRPIFAGPNVAATKINELRSAFDRMIVDADFLSDATSAHLDIAAISGVEIQKIVADITHSSPEIAQRLNAIIGSMEQNTHH
jgi:tripartite-type tricarboxylate transporter receptor subunit TctC